jgi:signal transduction histidine kinase
MKGLISRLSSVPKNIEVKREEVSLNILVHSVLKRLNTDGEKNVVITEELDSIPPICIDHEAMEMVFLNLITNAYEAIEKEGIIRVTASMNEGNINIKVSDTGAGMSEEYIENCVFKPFRSTKKSGFGIGLYQCKTIVDAHGGKIEVESKKGMGTTFTIKLPLRCEDSVEGGNWKTADV